jgi:enterochelin esterase-like enzyme
MKNLIGIYTAALCCVLIGAAPVLGQATPPASAPPGAAPATAPATGPATAPGGRAGARGGRGGRGGAPLTAEDQAIIAKGAQYPAWKAGSGNGNFSQGPEYANAPELTPKDGVPKGRVETFTLNTADSKIFPPTGLRGRSATRQVTVYIPSQYVPGTEAALMVTCDAYGARNNVMPTILDNMIADKRVPVMIAVMIANGGGDGPGSQRGMEYDNMSGAYAEFVETEILPKVEKDYNVKISKNPEARMTVGGSSGGSAAFAMAWFHPELYRKSLIFSGTFVNQHQNEQFPRGAWGFPESVVADTPKKPLRLWLQVSERDNGATQASTGFRNWVIANLKMADALQAKGYDYQFVFSKDAGHTEAKVINMCYPQALEYLWKGYPGTVAK